MDRRSWLWRKKSSEKSPGETDSSGSISSHSERYSDDQDPSRASPVHNTQSPEVTSKSPACGEEVNDHVKILTDKLSAALLNISAKEDLVKQHAKVAEEAVTGWEKAENEGLVFKQQLDAATLKNSVLEDRVGHLDGALKECVRQLRQAREEQEQKIHEAVVKKTQEWESTKFELVSKLDDLQTQVQAESPASDSPDILLKLDAAENEISTLKLKLLARAKELEIKTLERDLSIQSAETASKQHLESIKKVAKLEAECRKLRAAARKGSGATDPTSFVSSSIHVESFTDSQSDSAERLMAIETDSRKMNSLELNECELSCSDSWASALIAELDQFKNEKTIGRNLTTSSVEISLMDDFLEMEKLAALPETGSGRSISDEHNNGGDQSKAEVELLIQRTAELEEKLDKMEVEKTRLEIALAETQDHLQTSQDKLRETEEKLVDLQRKLDLVIESQQVSEAEMKSSHAKREAIESQFVAMEAEVRTLRTKVDLLEAEVEDERALSAEIRIKCRTLEDELSKKRRETELRKVANSNGELKIKQEKELAVAAGKLAECQKTIASLGQQLKSLATLEDFMIDTDKPLELDVGSPVPESSGDLWKLHPNDAYFPKTGASDLSKTIPVDGSGPSLNGKDGESPPSSSSSSSSSVNHVISTDKSRNGFTKLFTRNKSGPRVENL